MAPRQASLHPLRAESEVMSYKLHLSHLLCRLQWPANLQTSVPVANLAQALFVKPTLCGHYRKWTWSRELFKTVLRSHTHVFIAVLC